MDKITSAVVYTVVFFAFVTMIVSQVSTYQLTQDMRAETEAKAIHCRSLAKSNLDELIRCQSVGGVVKATEQGVIECSE